MPGMNHVEIDVAYVARLARLKLDETEIGMFRTQLAQVLGHVETLAELDGEDEASGMPEHFGLMRDDLEVPGLAAEAFLALAPDRAQDQVRVPKVIAEA